MAQAWEDFPEAMDFLRPRSPNFGWKSLQSSLYHHLAGDHLRPRAGAAVLDAACGVGRFAVPMARDGAQVLGIDASLPSLRAAARHGAGLGSCLRLLHGDVTALPSLLDGQRFDLVLAMELLSYVPNAAIVSSQLTDAAGPGGTVIASVEAWPGALLSDPSGLDDSTLTELLQTRTLAVRDDRWVRAFTAAELATTLREAGLTDVEVKGTHWLSDGPLSALLDPELAGRTAEQDRIAAIEDRLREDPSFRDLPRAWLAWGRRPG
jgi:2-polyprenyl-3-methyl-5-hydroxy-6-metoxy-1,4-benzoquinol methylase